MKKNDFLLLLATALYSGLFYEQLPGINFLIFTIAILVMSIIYRKDVLNNRIWIFSASVALISSACLAWHGTFISFLANLISLALVAALAVNRKTSVIAGMIMMFVNIVTSWYNIAAGWIPKRNPGEERPARSRTFFSSRMLAYIIPLPVVIIFIGLYRASNSVFDHYAAMINLDFISFNWVVFTLTGALLMYAFFYFKDWRAVSNFDITYSGIILKDGNTGRSLDKLMPVQNENHSGIILFVLVNILLLSVNVIDINFLFLGHELPKGINYSQMVHEGVNALIWSIILAVSIILFYFRGRLNFYENNKGLKLLTFAWIVQNIFLVVSTGYRNFLYISADGMTPKRLGVYFYLGLCIIGLVLTFVKIIRYNTNWQLVREVTWSYLVVLILSCFIDWGAYITNYNYNYEVKHHKTIDGGYFVSLHTDYLKELIIQRNKDEKQNKADNKWREVDSKIFHFLDQWDRTDWRSWNVDDQKVYNTIRELSKQGILTSIKLEEPVNSKDLNVLSPLHFQALTLNNAKLDSLPDFKLFTGLKSLTLENDHLQNIDGIENLTNLEYLDLRGNNIEDYRPLAKLKNLKTLYSDYYGSNFDSTQVDVNHLMPDGKVLTVPDVPKEIDASQRNNNTK
jgi:hypothetical protein